MKKLFFLSLLSFILVSISHSALAIEIGDIYYSNKSFNSEIIEGLHPIGVVYWVNEDKQSGILISLDQPIAKNWQRSHAYCNLYLTRGTKSGDWHLPSILEMFPIDKLHNQRIDGKAFFHVNRRLSEIKEARPMNSGLYITASEYTGDKTSVMGVNIVTGELDKIKKKSRSNFRCMSTF